MDLSIRSLSMLEIMNQDQKIVEIGVEEGVDLGSRINEPLLRNVVL